jgi:acyl-CoA reductase-like NAD-dependent aldehyde dehydrogenase
MPNPKNGKKIPALIVFGRIRGSKVDQAAVFLEKDAEAAKRAASDAGLSYSKPQRAKEILRLAAQNLRPHRRRFPQISGGS